MTRPTLVPFYVYFRRPSGETGTWTRYAETIEIARDSGAAACLSEGVTIVSVTPACRCDEPAAGWTLCPHHGSLSPEIAR